MKKILIAAVALGGILAAGCKTQKDPVLLSVAGEPVTVSEFEYFYHKNDGNQVEQETPEQYLERFIDYKLKVAQARAERQDTTADFRKDFRQYRREIANPMLTDMDEYNRLLNLSYANTLENVNVDHIMLAPTDRALADSIYTLLSNGADFYDLAFHFSIDPSVKMNRGKYGWISAMQYPWEFEELAYTTPVGNFSKVGTSSFGHHIVRVNDRRPNEGQIHGSHILITPTAELDSAAAHKRADSIYSALRAGSSFEQLAMRHSACPSGRQGGDLDWFGRGQMIPQFEEVIFALPDGGISEPFLTRFGWHIARRIESRQPEKEQVMSQIKDLMARDSRSTAPRRKRAQQLVEEYGGRIDQAGREKLLGRVAAVGYDSVRSELAGDPTPLIIVGDSTMTIGKFVQARYGMNPATPQADQVANHIVERMRVIALTIEDKNLEAKYPEFRRQSNEYRDGLMLIASMEKNIWNRPTQDPEGLEAYFQANKKNYTYQAPRWKGYVLYATVDSIIDAVDEYLQRVKPTPEQLADSIKTNFPKRVRIERIVLPEGENQIVDHVGFGGPEPQFKASNRWCHYVTYMGRLINGAEEAADVRGRVSSDWTEALEKAYVEELRKRYEVKVNKRVLKKVK